MRVYFPHVIDKGGALVLRHKGQTHSFNSDPRLRWVAFYTDVEHEVEPVISGQRVSLAFNLYMTPLPGIPKAQPLIEKLIKGVIEICSLSNLHQQD